MARAEDLVVFKALAARPKDIEDAAALLLLHSTIDLARVRRRLAARKLRLAFPRATCMLLAQGN
jgi:prolyl-tRNA editing enzyme YbaK/EbsC (Cys-tRNA(Pro) deacylase)